MVSINIRKFPEIIDRIMSLNNNNNKHMPYLPSVQQGMVWYLEVEACNLLLTSYVTYLVCLMLTASPANIQTSSLRYIFFHYLVSALHKTLH